MPSQPSTKSLLLPFRFIVFIFIFTTLSGFIQDRIVGPSFSPFALHIRSIFLAAGLTIQYPAREHSDYIGRSVICFELHQSIFRNVPILTGLSCAWFHEMFSRTFVLYLRGGVTDDDLLLWISIGIVPYLAIITFKCTTSYMVQFLGYFLWCLGKPFFYGFIIVCGVGWIFIQPKQAQILQLLETLREYLFCTIQIPFQTYFQLEKFITDHMESRTQPLAPFQYKKLQKDQIRLLRLRKRLPFTPIRCELVHVSVYTDKEFEAVSYRWNENSPHKNIQLDGHNVSVQEAVFNVIRYSWSPLEEKYLWIDSLCIDQTSDAEKGEQISHMKTIYSRATRVIAWLGPLSGARGAWLMALILPDQYLRRGYSLESLRDQYCFVPVPSTRALTELFSRDWWGRVWILQEVAFAKSVHLVFGGVTTRWEMVVDVLPILTSPVFLVGMAMSVIINPGSTEPPAQRNGKALRDGLWNAGTLVAHRVYVQKGSPPSIDLLTQALTTTTGFSSTKPHDRIYAFLGLVEQTQHQITVDYQKPVEEVYTETMKSLLRSKEPLYALLLAGNGMPRKLQLPSWVPDWSSPPCLPTWYGPVDDKLRAGVKAPADVRVPEGTEPFIQITGTQVDTITELGPTALNMVVLATQDYANLSEAWSCASSDLNELRRWFLQTKAMVEKHSAQPYPCRFQNGEGYSNSMDDAFWITLVTGRTITSPAPDGTYATAKDYQDYQSFLDCVAASFSDGGNSDEPGSLTLGDWNQGAQRFSAPFSAVRERRIAVTEGNHLALVPQGTGYEDKIVTFCGAPVPYVLRARKEMFRGGSSWELVGPVYALGLMEGEQKQGRTEVFTLF